VVATNTYTDPGLRQLRAPARGADDLTQVLADPGIGGFAVTTVIDQPAQQVRLAIEDFLHGRGTQDLLLVYLSCHGLLDAHRRLYFAATDTRKDRLGSTGVESAWILDQLEHCRARRQILIIDSCFSGAFAHGAKGEADLGLKDRFVGQGRGRVVLTASNATEYSFEGEPTDAATAGSVFTAALVQGLRTGAADTDRDGHVSVMMPTPTSSTRSRQPTPTSPASSTPPAPFSTPELPPNHQPPSARHERKPSARHGRKPSTRHGRKPSTRHGRKPSTSIPESPPGRPQPRCPGSLTP
jgi:Caspase domain